MKIKANFYKKNMIVPQRGEISVCIDTTYDYMRWVVPFVPVRKNVSLNVPQWKVIAGQQRKWQPYLKMLQRVVRHRKAKKVFREGAVTIYWPPGKAGRTRLPDDDSMVYGLIPIRDLMKHLGFIFDDSMKWFHWDIFIKKAVDYGQKTPHTEFVLWTKKR